MKIDEEVKVTDKGDSAMGGFEYSHPSFGMISIHHGQGSLGNRLFGSEVESNRHTTIAVSECSVRQDLGKNWYRNSSEIVEVMLSPIQFAEFISTPNCSGVPCTIRYRSGAGYIVPKNIDTVTSFAKSKLEENGDDIKRTAVTVSEEVTAILNKKGTLTKSDRGEIASLVCRLSQNIASNFEFYEKNVHDNIHKAVSEAKADVDAHITHAINKIGIDTLSNPQAMKLLLESKEDKG
tara:strand:- start:134 stop:841 length:708 start_codon:yes stop_codon:yes gene_type:complete